MLTLLALAHSAAAGDLLFVLTSDGTVNSYDADGNFRGTVSLTNNQRAWHIAPSTGGRWIYAVDHSGGMHWINPIGLGTSQGSAVPLPEWGGEIAASADRYRVVYASDDLYAFSTADLSLIGNVVSGPGFYDVSASPSDPRVLMASSSNSAFDLVEYETVNWSLVSDEHVEGWVSDVDYDRDGYYRLVTYGATHGDTELRACPAGICDIATLPGGSGGRIGRGPSSFFYVSDAAGITPYHVDSHGIDLVGSTFGDPSLVDLGFSEDTRIYVLDDNRIVRVNPMGGNETTLVSFSDGSWKVQILVVPDRTRGFACHPTRTSCIRVTLHTLVAEATIRELPVGWLAGREIDCPGCDAGDLEDARAAAVSYLDDLRPEELTVAHTVTFLSQVHDLTRAEADWALDDELIRFGD